MSGLEAVRLADYIAQHAPVYVITGAGCSTESGIFDYRDESGAYKRKPPVQLADFLASAHMRKRYWARSMIGWPIFQRAQPNAAHHALRLLEDNELVHIVVTQNVDDLHVRAGHREVVPLHGSLSTVSCLACGHQQPREAVQRWLTETNAEFGGTLAAAAPDGDADLEGVDVSAFSVPTCPGCGGTMKPDVVFFGDSVPKPRVRRARAALEPSRGLLIVGSSVMVYSSFRFCREANDRGLPLAALNRGVTRADPWLTLRIDASAGATLMAACRELGLTQGTPEPDDGLS